MRNKIRHMRRYAAGVIAGAGLLAAAASPAAAAAGSAPAASVRHMPVRALPDGMSALTYRRMLAQVPLDNAAARIRQAVARPGAGHSGFVQIAVDDDHNRLMVYWHGAVTPGITSLLASLRHRAQVVVVPARYSTATLERAVRQVLHARSGLRVTEAGPLTDGSGIQVSVAGATLPPAASARRLFGVGVPVTITRGVVPRAASCYLDSLDTLGPPARCTDYSQFWGGAILLDTSVLINGGYPGCSTGFGVHSTVDSKQYMLTASHCANGGDVIQNGQDNTVLGTVYLINHGHDDEAILTTPGNQYYDGPGIFSGDTHNTKTVAKEQPSSVGDYLCESGATGGVMCSMKITALNMTLTYYDEVSGTNITVSRVAQTSKGVGGINGGLLFAGDSGGPVFSLASPGKVTAKGINLATDSNHNYFMTIDWISSDFKVQVNTG